MNINGGGQQVFLIQTNRLAVGKGFALVAMETVKLFAPAVEAGEISNKGGIMNYIIGDDNKVYESIPPFKEVGEITGGVLVEHKGRVVILTLNEEAKTRKPRKSKETPPENPAQD